MKEREQEAQAYAMELIEECPYKDYAEIQEWIALNKFAAIVDFMRDNDSWKRIVLNKLTEDHIELLDSVVFNGWINTHLDYQCAVNNILFACFYDDLADVNDLIISHLYDQKELESEPSHQEIDEEHNRDFERDRA